MSAWSLLYSPAVLTIDLLPVHNAPLPMPSRTSRSFGDALEPRYIFGADSLDQ